ncbi:hypothetical protein LINPERHAP2_LOCUS33342 [Linum perenne]
MAAAASSATISATSAVMIASVVSATIAASARLRKPSVWMEDRCKPRCLLSSLIDLSLQFAVAPFLLPLP